MRRRGGAPRDCRAGRGGRARERFRNVHPGPPGLRPAPRGCFFSVPPIPEASPVSRRPLPLGVALLCLLLGGAPRSAPAQAAPYDSTVFAGLKWREIGIFRGGRAEERRVGKECRYRWAPDHLKKKNYEQLLWK